MMKRNWKFALLSTVFSVGALSACNANDSQMKEINQVDDEVNPYSEENRNEYTKYNQDIPTEDTGLDDPNQANNDEIRTRGNKTLEHNEDPEQTEMWMEKGRDHEFDDNRGAE